MSARDAEHKTERYKLGELLSDRTDHFILLRATPHKGDPDNFSLFLQLLDRDVYGHVRSLEEAMRRQNAPFYLRRTKEALVTFPDPETGVVRKLFTERKADTVAFDLDDEELSSMRLSLGTCRTSRSALQQTNPHADARLGSRWRCTSVDSPRASMRHVEASSVG
jgi:hypothetical protein